MAVFGRSSTNSIRRGYLYGAVTRFTWSWSSATSRSDPCTPGFRTMKALTTSPRSGSGEATAAHSSTPGCSCNALSTSNGPMR